MDKYLQYNSEEFAIEESFINWVKETNPNDINYWNKWLLDHPEKKDDVHAARRIVETMVFADQETIKAKENAIWDKISSKIVEAESPQQHRRSVLRFLLPLAAAAIAGLIIFVNIPTGFSCDTHINSGIAETNQINLPDNSTVTVNTDSKLCYSKESWADHRIVELEGEAFFEVEKGSKFTVKTDNGDVEVLGTSFNVYSRNGQLFVECETGKVQVRSEGTEVILLPSENIKINGSENLVEKAETKSKRSEWRSGTFNYDGEKIDRVLQDMERTFGVDIDIPDALTQEPYTGYFNSQNIDSALYQVLWPLNLKSTKEGKVYIIQPSNK